MPAYPKRLIEVDLPIKRISAHARREKSIRHGHISTLHIWWARRPLAACRAVICAALWPDPADPLCPESFRAEARQLMLAWATQHLPTVKSTLSEQSCIRLLKIQKYPQRLRDGIELRSVLLDFIADFANWDNAAVKPFLETSAALTHSAYSALGGSSGGRPLVVDPFAGGGSIPLEALRIGADAFASDLNPIPVLLNKVILEYIPKYGKRLAESLEHWGKWIRAQAETRLNEFYPCDADAGTAIAYLWARTVLSEAPGEQGLPVQIPLLRSMWLSKRRDFPRALKWVRDTNGKVVTEEVDVEFRGQQIRARRPVLEVFTPVSPGEVGAGTVKGGAAICPVSDFTTPASRVKEQLKDHSGGANSARLYALYVQRSSGREFRVANARDLAIFQAAVTAARDKVEKYPQAFPTEPINSIRPYKNTRGLSAVTRVGCRSFSDLYNLRQLLSISTFYDALLRLPTEELGNDAQFITALRTVLALAINRSVSQNTSMSRWDASRLTIKGAFSKQALAVVWDFAEANPFSGATADWDGAIEWITKFIDSNAVLQSAGTVIRASALNIQLPSNSAAALITDPPYFAAIPYADLSDFFYVWFRRGLQRDYSDLLKSDLTEKEDELIVTNAERSRDGAVKDELFFREGMTKALASAHDVVHPQGIGVIVYAEGTTAGWEAILGAIIASNWAITSSWPIDTEMENRTQAQGSASLQSSIHIVCRPRQADRTGASGEVGDWRDVLQQLPTRIHAWMPRLADEGIVGADAIFACLGPALEVFSRYARVEKASGEPVTLREYLEQVWAAVAKEALILVFEGADATGFEADARLTAMWLWTLKGGDVTGDVGPEDEDDESDEESRGGSSRASRGGFNLEFDAARKIAQGLGADLESLGHLVEISGEIARLLPVAERLKHLFGKDDEDSPISTSKKKKSAQLDMFSELVESGESDAVWQEKTVERIGETTLDRVHQAMILFAAGRGEALKRFVVEDGVGGDGRFWRLAQALSALYPVGVDEKRWVDGVLARKKGFGF